MEYIGLAILAYLVVVWIYKAVRKAISKRRQRKLDEIALGQFGQLDLVKEREDIKSIASRFGFAKEKGETESVVGRYEFRSYRCPKCGGMLIERNGKYGKFLGCICYPKCLYTRNI